MVVALAALSAALVGAVGPIVIARLPEPADADHDKIAYADLAEATHVVPWFAAAAGIMAAVVAWRIPPELVPVWVLFAGVGTWLGYVDWRTRLLPFLLVAPAYLATWVLVATAAVLLDEPRVALGGLIGNVVMFGVFWLVYRIGRRFDGGAFGYGDVRLAGLTGLALGTLGAAETLTGGYAAFVLGAVGGLVCSRLGWVDRNGFAFGPYMVLGAIVGAAWGASIWAM